jgi:DNA-binding NtrC family response regulator
LRMGERTHDRLKVLVVEDDGDSREVLAEILAVDFDVRTAADGLAGLEAFEAEHPDVLITDETLPGLSGTALARRVKDLHPDARVVLVSGHATLPDTEACDVVLRKPVDIDKLAAAVGGDAWTAHHH